jgi:hypothetical protein
MFSSFTPYHFLFLERGNLFYDLRDAFVKKFAFHLVITCGHKRLQSKRLIANSVDDLLTV